MLSAFFVIFLPNSNVICCIIVSIEISFRILGWFIIVYTDADGSQQRPVMIHRAMFGSMERFIGILIENFKGAFPFWLAPTQVAVVPIGQEHSEYGKYVESMFRANRIRCEAAYEDANMKEKIKKYKTMKVPYIIVVGAKEAEGKTVSINIRGTNKQLHNIPLDEFLDICDELRENRSLQLTEEA